MLNKTGGALDKNLSRKAIIYGPLKYELHSSPIKFLVQPGKRQEGLFF